MWKCPCQISKLTQDIYHPPQKKANEKIINLALKKKSETSMKNSFNVINSKKGKEK